MTPEEYRQKEKDLKEVFAIQMEYVQYYTDLVKFTVDGIRYSGALSKQSLDRLNTQISEMARISTHATSTAAKLELLKTIRPTEKE